MVVVGPADAPSRTRAVPRVDALLARLAQEYGVPYVRTSDLDLAYLDDRLHLTAAGHREFGDVVAERIAALDSGAPGRSRALILPTATVSAAGPIIGQLRRSSTERCRFSRCVNLQFCVH